MNPLSGSRPKKSERPARHRPPALGSDRLSRQGVPVSGGLAAGPVHLVLPEELPISDHVLAEGEEAAEVRRFRVAARRARDEVQALRECLVSDPDEAGQKILDAHLRLLEDPELLQSVVHGIRSQSRPAAQVVRQVFQRMITALESAGTEYFRARSADIRDVKRRILRHLEGGPRRRSSIPSGVVVVAPELSPSESAFLDPERVAALVTDHGGATSHAAILARSRGIPAVSGLGDLSQHLSDGDWALVDGYRGLVVVRPDEGEAREFERRRQALARRARALSRHLAEPAVTLDGHRVELLANIESAADVGAVLRAGVEGVGLYRSEYFYLAAEHLPDEAGQVRAYRQVVRRLRPRPVTIRTLDVGGDKFASYLGLSRVDNPYLGVRGIRFSLLHPEILKTQLRAVLRAAAHGQVRVLYPMISSVEEVRAANALLEEAEQELQSEGLEIGRVERGIMIEVPAAVTMADQLAREVDFFSIGSNDLVQYILAVDRGNEKVAHLYDPFHPAVLRALVATIDAGLRAGIRVTSCGEISGDPYGAAVLLGMGCMSLSMSAPQIGQVKELIRKVHLVELRSLAEAALRLSTVSEVRDTLTASLGPILGLEGPELSPPSSGFGREARGLRALSEGTNASRPSWNTDGDSDGETDGESDGEADV